jgi:hypothetical protein
MATWFVIDRATWIDVREVPRRERLRASLRIGA